MTTSEPDSLIKALSEAQDQLLAISTLTNNTQHDFNLDELLQFYLKRTQEILGADAVFILYQGQSDNFLTTIEEIRLPYVNARLDWKEFQLCGYLANMPFYALSRFVEDNARIALGFSVDTPQESLNPTIKLAAAIIDQAVVQISNILLHDKLIEQTRLQAELDAAREMQLSLLPKGITIADLPKLDIAVHFCPARATGGDFYDYAIIDKGFGFTVGDIAGKGLPATLLMAITLNSIRAKAAFLPNSSPEKILTRVNQDLYSDFTQASAFVTIFSGYYSPAEEKIFYANAGHSPVIYCAANGTVELLEADGPALGVLKESLSTNQQLNFRSGDLLVIGTDGFSEAENVDGKFFGYENLLNKIDRLHQRSAEEIKNELVAAINTFAGDKPQSDDQTLLVIKKL